MRQAVPSGGERYGVETGAEPRADAKKTKASINDPLFHTRLKKLLGS